MNFNKSKGLLHLTVMRVSMSENRTKKTRILWAGKKRSGIPSFVPGLIEAGYKVTIVETGKEVRERLAKKFKPSVLIVDAASMRTIGTRLCKSIRANHPGVPVILINSKENLPVNEISADVQLVVPFTIRKLINRILLFVPGDGNEIITAGPIHLDLDRQILRCHDCEEHITPCMADLLKMLIRKKGEVLKREVLFSKIWKTNYTEDTRSLDVHIYWLRKIIEKDPSQPKIIRTVRGIGYKFDL